MVNPRPYSRSARVFAAAAAVLSGVAVICVGMRPAGMMSWPWCSAQARNVQLVKGMFDIMSLDLKPACWV